MINWAKLYNQGRVKAVGIPWSAEESKALREIKIPVEYVRSGILTLEAYTKALESECKDGKPIERWVLSELKPKATELGINFTPGATEYSLAQAIKKELNNREAAEQQESIVAEAMKKNAEAEAKAKATEQAKAEKEKEKLRKDEEKKEKAEAEAKAKNESKKLSEKGGKNE